MSENYVLKEHREWITSLQPVGLVVSANALENAQLRLQKDVFEAQETFKSLLDPKGQLLPLHVVNLFTRFLGWRQEDLISGNDIKDLEAYLPERETILKPDYAVRNIDTGQFDILIKNVDGFDLDASEEVTGRVWEASPHTKFERLLREKNISIGILINQSFLRLIYAPKGETSGYMTFPFSFMREVQGRAFIAGLKLLLSEDRLFRGVPKQRLQVLLSESRKFQNDVSTQLSQQVLAALYELVRGLQAADDEVNGKLLKDVLNFNKNDIYHGLLTVILRTVFTLYAEDRDLISSDPVFLNNYSINGLYTKLREDFSKHHDSMDLRYGAWAHLLSLYRLIYEGIELETDSIPGRKGHLFDPDRFPFLEGRNKDSAIFTPPKISDGIIWRVLSNLMTLDGERISYRALDVEQIGSVYETVMGFQLEVAEGPSIAIKPTKSYGAPVVINLDTILKEKADKRTAKLKELTDQKFEGKIADAIKKAKDTNDLMVAIEKKIADWATPSILEAGAMILQPSNERRRSGSHYTPRSLTAPIVSKVLKPILNRLGNTPTPDQILELKICDPAMGSGAFLVEVCRQLSEVLVKSWAIHQPDIRKEIPPDEDELLYARRLIAQRCLYGVDKNPMAVNLGKLSLWLATFAKYHEFTFLDHNLKSGDSLVGLGLSQILAATWEHNINQSLPHASISQRMQRVKEVRTQISTANDSTTIEELSQLKQEEDLLLEDLRGIGDAITYSFFSAEKPRDRKIELNRIHLLIETWFASGIPLKNFNGLNRELKWLRDEKLLRPFYWDCEFPEVFRNEEHEDRNGFDAMIGNPPFAGKNNFINSNLPGYLDWLLLTQTGSNGNADLSSFFFRRGYDLIRNSGIIGFIATNTISQGDTRQAGLGWICNNGGTIFDVAKRIRWPGDASVIVSTCHIIKNDTVIPKYIDNKEQQKITSFFRNFGDDNLPIVLKKNSNLSYKGAVILGAGFTFDDSRIEDGANSVSSIGKLGFSPSEKELIRPYIGGEEVNDSPTHLNRRFAIDFQDMPLTRIKSELAWAEMSRPKQLETLKSGSVPEDYTEPVATDFPNLLRIVEAKVKPVREKDKRATRKKFWWRFGETVPALRKAIDGLPQVIVCSQTSKHFAFTFLSSQIVFDQKLVVIASQSNSLFSVIQSRVHEVWANMFGSTLEDRPVYTPSDCFDTFPFPREYENNRTLTDMGRRYFEARRDLMVKSNEGMTKTYNRFHDPSDSTPEILEFRKLHSELDAIVLAAYGWSDIKPIAEFIAEYDDEVASTSYRLKWPDNIRDMILERLIDLNAKYASEEATQRSKE